MISTMHFYFNLNLFKDDYMMIYDWFYISIIIIYVKSEFDKEQVHLTEVDVHMSMLSCIFFNM